MSVVIRSHYDLISNQVIATVAIDNGRYVSMSGTTEEEVRADLENKLYFHVDMTWTDRVRGLLPRALASRLQFAARDGEQMLLWWYDEKKVSLLPHSPEFPTELDIARICVEAP